METYDALLASITPDTGETRTIMDPATGEPVGEAPVHTVADLDAAIAAAAAARLRPGNRRRRPQGPGRAAGDQRLTGVRRPLRGA